jgi:hypothetical protein
MLSVHLIPPARNAHELAVAPVFVKFIHHQYGVDNSGYPEKNSKDNVKDQRADPAGSKYSKGREQKAKKIPHDHLRNLFSV